MIELMYWDINNTSISEKKYIDFLKQYYGSNTETQQRYERVKWYHKWNNYKILLAVLDNEIVGQTSAFKCIAVIKGYEQEWWWGVDGFVLPNMRGKGIGKKLQYKLHQDLPNFSSLWYSPLNGIIKKKCGANEIASINFNYYPVCNYFCFLCNIAFKKIFNINNLAFNFNKYNFYYYINKTIHRKISLLIQEIDFPNSKYENFINECMSQYDIYIKRDINYLRWKYKENPTLNYHSLAIYSKEKETLLGIVTFTDVFERMLYNKIMKVVAILDLFIRPDSILSNKDILLNVIQYINDQKIHFDGVISLHNINYFPLFRYPFKGSSLLSTNRTICNKPYFSYSDQDMEQMI